MEGQSSDDNSVINISDVIEVIETDQAFGSMQPRRPSAEGVNTGAFIKIIEQPASKALRFRYECEGRSAGSLPGANSTPENKTFPTIQIVGYSGRAVVVVSCVTKDPPYKPHPHNLVGRENCKNGVCSVELSGESMTATFANLGIQCVKKKDIEEALKVREKIRLDPFRTGFGHKSQTSTIDLNSVRLCFQAFLEGPPRKFMTPLQPVVSDPIYDKKAMADLIICKLSHCSASVAGGQEVILLCEKVAKEDISVKFFEQKDGQILWEAYGDFTPAQVHRQSAISFRTPRYKTLEIEQPIHACIQLRRPSDGETSDPLPFQITPLDSDPQFLKRKRQKCSNENDLRNLTDPDHLRMLKNEGMTVKREPVTSPNPHMVVGPGNSQMRKQLSPIYARTPSPQQPFLVQGGATYITTGHTSGGHMYIPPMDQPPVAIQPQLLTEPRKYFLNMDTQECSLEVNFNRFDPNELVDFDGALSSNLSATLNLGDQVSHTDSLTRLATNTYNELCDM